LAAIADGEQEAIEKVEETATATIHPRDESVAVEDYSAKE